MMSLVIAMCLFAFSMSISPGPVNLIVLSSGVNHGVRKTMPFVFGAVVGFSLLLLTVGLGIGEVIGQTSALLMFFCLAGNVFIFYIGIKLFFASADIAQLDAMLPTFSQGVMLQWLNPKAWIACLAGVSAFNLVVARSDLWLFVCLYFVVCLISMSSWALAGDKVSGYLIDQRRILIFNKIMGGLLMLLALYLGLSYFLSYVQSIAS